MQKTTHSRSANRTLVGLHSHYLTAIDAEAHVSTGKNHCVFGVSVADHTFTLAFICQVGSIVINSINVIQIHDLIVVKQLLLQELVPHVGGAVFLERTVSELNILLSLASIAFWIHRFDRNHDWIEVILHVEQVIFARSQVANWSTVVFRRIDDKEIMWELLF